MPQGRQGREGPLAAARDLVGAAYAALEASRERIDNLNVYPVPDGDTGSNMTLTVRAVADALAGSEAGSREEIARVVTRACLMGARGNSGVILSQWVRGVAEALAERDLSDGRALAAAVRAGADAAYAAVREPQEGTILTVARALADGAESARDASIEDALAAAVESGERALEQTPELLPLLADAGVVDAGGAGLLEIVRGIVAYARGEPLPEIPALVGELPLEAVHRELSRYRYCTSFFVEGEEADPDIFDRELRAFGDSVLVVGSRGAVKVHFHTDDPGRALDLGTSVGVLEEIDIKNMHVQTALRTERLAVEVTQTGVVAVCPGEGNRRLFESLGAVCVPGGQSMNPSTADLVAAIAALPAREALVLPNNENVILAARRAVEAADKPARVLPTRSLQAGLGAMVAFDAGRSAEENAAEMEAAAAGVRAGAVTQASRKAAIGGLAVEEGQFLGLVDGEPVQAGSVLEPVARVVIERLLDGGADVLTVLLGDGAEAPNGLLAEVRDGHPELEIEVHEGGQPHYPLLLAAE